MCDCLLFMLIVIFLKRDDKVKLFLSYLQDIYCFLYPIRHYESIHKHYHEHLHPHQQLALLNKDNVCIPSKVINLKPVRLLTLSPKGY